MRQMAPNTPPVLPAPSLIDALEENPGPRGAEKIEGRKNLYRIRSGDYRIIYEIQGKILLLLILVVKIGHRREVYERL
jgi:mRNA interferase RelE/StbE